MSVAPSQSQACYCVNPYCSQPYPQRRDDKTCQTCGVTLRLGDRYVPLQQLQVGNSTYIYLVYDLVTGTERIMRVLAAKNTKPLAIFHQEALILTSLYDRGLPRIDVGGYFHIRITLPQQSILSCLVMEKIEGVTLQDVLDQHPNGCPEAWVLDWLRQAATILQKLHKRRLLHRNLTPSSFVLRPGNQQLVVSDFRFPSAIASSEHTQTVSYRAPEQIKRETIAPATDFYALGQICIHLLTGRPPSTAKDSVTGESRWRQRSRISPALANLLDKLVQPEMRMRPLTAIDLLEQITQVPTKIPPAKLTLNTSSSPLHSSSGGSVGDSAESDMASSSGWLNSRVFGRTGSRSRLSAASSVGVDSHSGGIATSSTSTGAPLMLMSAASYRGDRAAYHAHKRSELESLKTHLEDTIANISDLQSWLLHICTVLFRVMLFGGLSGGLAAALGFWVTYWSPLTPHIYAFFAQQVASPVVPLVLTPAMIVFGFAGVGTTWGLTQTRSVELEQQRWGQRCIGGIGYAIAWVTWQWATSGLTISEAIARLTAIIALGLMISLGTHNHLITQAIVMMLGTSATFSTLIQVKLWEPGLFLNLFRSVNAFNPDTATFWSTVNFFGLLGVVLSSWLVFNHYVTTQLLEQLGRLLKHR